MPPNCIVSPVRSNDDVLTDQFETYTSPIRNDAPLPSADAHPLVMRSACDGSGISDRAAMIRMKTRDAAVLWSG